MHGSGSGLRRTVALVLVAAAAAATAPDAGATTVSFGPDSSGVFRLTIADAQGVSDNVLVQEEESSFLVFDQASTPTLTEATGCRREPNPRIFRCGEGAVSSIILLLQVDSFLGAGMTATSPPRTTSRPSTAALAPTRSTRGVAVERPTATTART